MRTARLLPAVLALGGLLLVGCNNKSTTATGPVQTGAPAAASPSAPAATAASASPDAFGCPTSNTTAFAKTKFVAHAGLAFGTFHRYIYKPARAGSFGKGAHGRVRTVLKAGATALFDKREIRLAIGDVQANPTLCKVLAQPLSNLGNEIGSLGTQIRSGSITGVQSAESAIAAIEAKAKGTGDPIAESTDTSASTQ